PAAGVPEMVPSELIERPVGKPLAVKVSASPSGSSKKSDTPKLKVSPSAALWGSGSIGRLSTAGLLATVTFNVKAPLAVLPLPSVTLTVMLNGEAAAVPAAGAPEIAPLELIER